LDVLSIDFFKVIKSVPDSSASAASPDLTYGKPSLIFLLIVLRIIFNTIKNGFLDRIPYALGWIRPDKTIGQNQ
jgi:hypothetical protein